MSQKKVYLFSPDGKEEGWFMEDETPGGWLRSKPEPEEIDNESEVPAHSGGLTDVDSEPEPEIPPQVADQTQVETESNR